MSSTEPQTGVRFRLGSSRAEKESDGADDPMASEEAPEVTDVAEPAGTDGPPDGEDATVVNPASGKQPTRLMADLTRAMQTAALTARSATMEQFTADAKSQTEAVHQRAAEEASGLRQRAEDDIAAIRDWSKAEMARLREETEERISGRRTSLEHELEAHAARVERRLEVLQDRVRAYEGRMDRFFETLMAEENAARIASMAEQMPEPPSFDDDFIDDFAPEPPAQVQTTDETAPSDTAEAAPDAGTETRAHVAEASIVAGLAESDGLAAWGDPRLAALGMANAETDQAGAVASEDDLGGEEVPEMDDETLAARLAGILPAEEPAAPEAGEPVSTQVKVVGLVSVAAIAGFKRSLSRVEGVSSVGVSSGPDGHFLFAVVHSPTVALRDAIPTFAGFEARVTGTSDGALEVSARDPEAGS
jgi:hypothetical protein